MHEIISWALTKLFIGLGYLMEWLLDIVRWITGLLQHRPDVTEVISEVEEKKEETTTIGIRG